MEPARTSTPRNELHAAFDNVAAGDRRTHAVQFYEDDAFLATSVGEFLANGLATRQYVVAVATPAHRQGIRTALEARGVDVERAVARRQMLLLDAEEVLATFMDGARPNAGRFRSAMARVLHGHDTGGGRATARVFGEMVDLLCRAGNIEGALQLESLWNELARSYCFSLLCGYSMPAFPDHAHALSVASICREHAHVIPTERYMQADDDARLREIALLQQRAQALSTEVTRGQELERSLRDALNRADAANRAKSQFLAVMSHELRTPLNAIGGHVQLLEMELYGPVNDRQREALARVQSSQRHLLALINDVLNLAKTESGQIDYALEPVLLGLILDEVASLLGPLFATSALTCRVVIGDDALPLVVRADREKLHQILLNLLGNAVKFTPGGGTVTVHARPSSDSAELIDIEVRDTGVGIAADKLDYIFEPFVQLGGSAVAQRDGIGLGLSISRTLARGMGGELRAASTPGVGSTFRLRLPRH
jgi:signal transduction histidine kinase